MKQFAAILLVEVDNANTPTSQGTLGALGTGPPAPSVDNSSGQYHVHVH